MPLFLTEFTHPTRRKIRHSPVRRGSSLIIVLILMLSIGLLIAGFSIYQAYALRALQARGSESRTGSGSLGIARALAERLSSVATQNLGVVTLSDLNSIAIETPGILNSLSAGFDDQITIQRGKTRAPNDLQALDATLDSVPETGYVILSVHTCGGGTGGWGAGTSDSAAFVRLRGAYCPETFATSDTARSALPSESMPIGQSSDEPRRGQGTPQEISGSLGIITADVEVRATVEGARGVRTTTRARIRVTKIPPWQQALTLSGPAGMVFNISTSNPVVSIDTLGMRRPIGAVAVSGPLTIDGAALHGTGSVKLSGPTTVRDGLIAASGLLQGRGEGSVLNLGILTRSALDSGVAGVGFTRWTLPGLLAAANGFVRPVGSMGLPLVTGRELTGLRSGRGECPEGILAWPRNAVERGQSTEEQIACRRDLDAGHALFSPDVQVRAITSGSPGSLRFVLGPGLALTGARAAEGSIAAIRAALSAAVTYRWPLPPMVASTLPADSPLGTIATAYDAPEGRAPWATRTLAIGDETATVWRGILPDLRRSGLGVNGVLNDIAVGNGSVAPTMTQMRSYRNGKQPFGYLLDLETLRSSMAGVWPRSSGLFFSFARSEDSRVRGRPALAEQESVVILPPRAPGGCLLGPLTVHSLLPVYIVGSLNDKLRCATYVPVMIDAPTVTILPPEAWIQAMNPTVTFPRWDFPNSSQRPLPIIGWSAPDADAEVRIGAVLRTRMPANSLTPAWRWAPQVYGDWSRIGLRITGSVEVLAVTNTSTLGDQAANTTWPNAFDGVLQGARPFNRVLSVNSGLPPDTTWLYTGPVVEPAYRHYLFEDALLSPAFQPPGSWDARRMPDYARRGAPGCTGGSSLTPCDAPWNLSLRNSVIQRRAWWGGTTAVRLIGGYETMASEAR